MATLRELKGRIGSVASSEKITGAMKMISSAKMHKAEGILRRLTPFRNCVQAIIANLLSSDAVVSSPLTESRHDVKRAALVLLGSDDGLCGAYNVNIFKGALQTIADMRSIYGDALQIEIFVVGKKLAQPVQKLCTGDDTLTFVPAVNVDSRSEGTAVKEFARMLEDRFVQGYFDSVRLQYMHYHSAGRQRLTDEQYLPIRPEALGTDGAQQGRPYLFEPDAATIYRTVLPMFLLSQMQEAFAQNRASEQAARVMAMQSANDNAQKDRKSVV